MSDYIDTRQGWTEVSHSEAGEEYVVYTDGSRDRYWVREEPVVPLPPLPTAAYTVIRVTWVPMHRALNDLFMLLPEKYMNDSQWRGAAGSSKQAWLIERISGFEVLSEPRAVVTKAVLGRVRETGVMHLLLLANPANGDELDQIAREFGASA